MSAEWLGVHTGYLFGDYVYGESLGPKWFGVPIIIGINWVMLTVISASVIQLLKVHWLLKTLLATILMLLLDILIEPVAIVSDYWVWNGEIPISNFIGWIIIAFILQTLYFGAKLAEPNKVGISLYIIQVLFFLTLNII
jgi:putative membrane protein